MRTVCIGWIGLIAVAFLGCAACEQNRKTSKPIVAPTVEEETGEECFSTCMKANQMRATAIELIEADCKKSCGTP